MERSQSWRPDRGGLERRDERRREVVRNARRGAQGDGVNKPLRKSVEGKSLAPQVGLEPTTLRLTGTFQKMAKVQFWAVRAVVRNSLALLAKILSFWRARLNCMAIRWRTQRMKAYQKA